MAPMPENWSRSKTRVSLAVISGFASAGITLGLFVGLSASPIVGSVASGIVGLAAGALGFSALRSMQAESENASIADDGKAGIETDIATRGLAITALCLGIIVTSPLALWARTHGSLSEPLLSDAIEVDSIKRFSPEVRRIVFYHRYGLDIGSKSLKKPASAVEQPVDAHSSHAESIADTTFFATIDPGQCSLLLFNSTDDATKKIRDFQSQSKPWPQVAAGALRQGKNQRLSYLRGAYDAICAH